MPVDTSGVWIDAGGPAESDEAVVGAAAQGEVGGVGVAAVLPVGSGVVDFAAIGGCGASGAGAAAVAVLEQESLGFGGQPFGAGQVQRFGGVAFVDGEVVKAV
ncbi:hypothetical protein SAMN04488583_2418 [Mycobacterium sp. 88mf]|nr:hypothetical protein SAMN04488583_2418 [Mycobacterium sp. 88mf]SFF45925.1 hypothetical protein SAMN04488582_102754 [Mycobacterium sp. 455mf]